jgi:hypothetical protein
VEQRETQYKHLRRLASAIEICCCGDRHKYGNTYYICLWVQYICIHIYIYTLYIHISICMAMIDLSICVYLCLDTVWRNGSCSSSWFTRG